MESNSKNGLLLFYHPTSSYSQLVLMSLHEKQLKFSRRYVDLLRNEQHAAWYLKLNSYGEVPTLCDGVKVIPESGRIIEYLEDNFSDDEHRRLIPNHLGKDVKDKVLHYRDLVGTISMKGITFGTALHPSFAPHPKPPVCSTLYKLMRYKVKTREYNIEKYALVTPSARTYLQEKINREKLLMNRISDPGQFAEMLNNLEAVLEEVERELLTHHNDLEWLCCEEFTVADVYLSVLLNRLYFLGYENLWRNGRRPCLELYFNRVSTRQSFESSCQECPTILKFIYLGDCVYRTMPVLLTVGALVIAWMCFKYH